MRTPQPAAERLTAAQFKALAGLVGLRVPSTVAASRLVLVDGMAPSTAADNAGISRQQLSNVLGKLRAGLTMARQVCDGLPDCPGS